MYVVCVTVFVKPEKVEEFIEATLENARKTRQELIWREKIADWMAQPRQGVKHYSIFPKDSDW